MPKDNCCFKLVYEWQLIENQTELKGNLDGS